MAFECPFMPPFNATTDLHHFLSRPDIQAPRFYLQYAASSSIIAGKYMISPWRTTWIPPGPYIYDEQGQLIWSGSDTFIGAMTHGLHVCNYMGAPNLCVWEGRQIQVLGRGRGVVLDESYDIVREIWSDGMTADFHDFQLVDGGREALMLVTKVAPADLSSVRGKPSATFGWVISNGFQKIDLVSGKSVFSWLSLDHIDVSESVHAGGTIDGTVDPISQPWDYIHLNSIAMTAAGDYLLSARHTSTVYKVSGRNGTILWRLGNHHSDFSIDFRMGYQHDVRIIEELEDTTFLSLYNNGWDGVSEKTANTSYAMIVKLDHRSCTATTVREYRAPGIFLSANQGSLQSIAGSSNKLVNWANRALITEYLENGTEVISACFPFGVTTLRAFKGPWVGRPKHRPDLWTYSKTSTAKTACYVSWNGATEVKSWRFYHFADENDFPPVLIGSTDRTGFETLFVYEAHAKRVFAEALSATGTSLGNSSVVSPFVPGPLLARHCDDLKCEAVLEEPTDSVRLSNASDQKLTCDKSLRDSYHNTSLQLVLAVVGALYLASLIPGWRTVWKALIHRLAR